ncbi:hypothetical protein [Qipengyuania nanhaisediminis]|uniref:Aspartate-semialdehyde dehydrogenase n=1 Tax=Qipengyuania nanhaisediminis TaxID=604088 RepID=A0A1I5MX95_9SPHN|nr:hypothetical protein [Qipengyuania nanhaisediminis]SFP13756.1 hypothetical protein SAMN04488060_1606 [Qipengyuania nanhaisediminis]
MIRAVSLAALPIAIGLAACSDEPAPEPAPTQVVDRFEEARIIVNANGLAAASDKGAMVMRFGSPRAEVDAMAESAWGEAGEQSRQEECGAGAMDFTSYGPLQIAYQDDRFAGWFVRGGDGVVTSDGIRTGATLEALKSERQVREIDSTLPGEFEYTTGDFGTIRGFAEDGTITALQAGLSCFFR